VDVIQRRRLACDRLPVEDGLLGVAAAVDADHAEDLVADLEGGRLRAAFLNDARNVAPERVGQPVFPDGRVLAASNLEIHRIDARRLDGDQDLRRIRKRRSTSSPWRTSGPPKRWMRNSRIAVI
jgi:hypothetical protein